MDADSRKVYIAVEDARRDRRLVVDGDLGLLGDLVSALQENLREPRSAAKVAARQVMAQDREACHV